MSGVRPPVELDAVGRAVVEHVEEGLVDRGVGKRGRRARRVPTRPSRSSVAGGNPPRRRNTRSPCPPRRAPDQLPGERHPGPPSPRPFCLCPPGSLPPPADSLPAIAREEERDLPLPLSRGRAELVLGGVGFLPLPPSSGRGSCSSRRASARRRGPRARRRHRERRTGSPVRPPPGPPPPAAIADF